MSARTEAAGYVFDTYAWVEYLAGSAGAKKVAGLLGNSPRRLVTPATVIAELAEKLLREGVEEDRIQGVVRFIAHRTQIYPCDERVAHRAGKLNFEQKKKVNGWGMLDSLNYAVASVLGFVFVTGDPHFRDFGKDVLLLR